MTKGALTEEYMGFNVFSIIPLVVYGIFIKFLYVLESIALSTASLPYFFTAFFILFVKRNFDTTATPAIIGAAIRLYLSLLFE